MKKIKIKPFALFRMGWDLKHFLPKELAKDIEDSEMYGVVLDVKNLDKMNKDGNPKLFMDYLFGQKITAKTGKDGGE